MVNIKRVEGIAHHHPYELFDPNNQMVGQEDSLMKAMKAHLFIPKISLCSFVFHYKSKTVQKSTDPVVKRGALSLSSCSKRN
jgi:hypothetical protein